MKILLLNPHADAEQQLTQALGAKGVAVLQAGDMEEAWKILLMHGSTVDLAIIHRETLDGRRTPGMELVHRIKQDPQNRDLPLLLTSSVWKEAEFGNHQSTPEGANAYLSWPVDVATVISTAEAIIGPLGESAPVEMGLGGDLTPMAPAPSAPLEAPSAQALLSLSPDSESPEGISVGRMELPAPPSLAPSSPDLSPSLDAPASLEPGPAPELAPDLSPSLAPSLAPDLPSQASSDDADEVMQVQMPYLMRSGPVPVQAAVSLAKAVPEAIVPGGAANAPDLETMRQYLLLREQDVVALSSQLKSARDQIAALEKDVAREKGRVSELEHTVKEQKSQIDEFEREKALATEGLQAELNEMKFQMKARADKVKLLEGQVREANLEMERLKERVRMDLRKIRVREKELESRLEVMKKDSEALIGARETRIIELKRKLDLLEFNMDLLQDQYQREKDNTEQLRERLAKAAQVVNVAGGLLETRERKVS